MGGGTKRLSFKRDFLWGFKRMDWKDEMEEEAARLNNDWLALFHSDTEDEYFESF